MPPDGSPQGVRMNQVFEHFESYEAAEFSQAEGCGAMGIGEPDVPALGVSVLRMRAEAGLLDRRLGKASGKRVPSDRSEEVEALYRTRYAGFTAKHFHEHLVKEHNFSWAIRGRRLPLLEGFC